MRGSRIFFRDLEAGFRCLAFLVNLLREINKFKFDIPPPTPPQIRAGVDAIKLNRSVIFS